MWLCIVFITQWWAVLPVSASISESELFPPSHTLLYTGIVVISTVTALNEWRFFFFLLSMQMVWGSFKKGKMFLIFLGTKVLIFTFYKKKKSVRACVWVCE